MKTQFEKDLETMTETEKAHLYNNIIDFDQFGNALDNTKNYRILTQNENENYKKIDSGYIDMGNESRSYDIFEVEGRLVQIIYSSWEHDAEIRTLQ